MDAYSADTASVLLRIAIALERLAPPGTVPCVNADAPAFVWDGGSNSLTPVAASGVIPLAMLRGLDAHAKVVLDNTEMFARGKLANNVLLWGARGMGKSALVKAVHVHLVARGMQGLKLVEIHRDDLASLGQLLQALAAGRHRYVLFCDDLSFDQGEGSYRSLKSALDGGIGGRPDNVVFYATSNRRHLMPRSIADNERETAINPGEAVHESVSLSDRFGIWLGFHACSGEMWLDMVRGYAGFLLPGVDEAVWRPAAIEWSRTRGAMNGRTAWQFMLDLAGRSGVDIAAKMRENKW